MDRASDWEAWLATGTPGAGSMQPDVSFLPPLLRRRLGAMGRMALAVAWPCAAGEAALPCVFASRHGVLQRTLDLLQSLARHDPLSPSDFSLSVHNSAAGLFSIARHDRSAASAVAAGEDSLSAGILEGLGLLADGQEQVLVVYADMPLPEPYAAHSGEATTAFAAALLLQRAGEQAPCRLARVRGHAAPPRPAPQLLMEFLLERSPRLPLPAAGSWELERVTPHGN